MKFCTRFRIFLSSCEAPVQRCEPIRSLFPGKVKKMPGFQPVNSCGGMRQKSLRIPSVGKYTPECVHGGRVCLFTPECASDGKPACQADFFCRHIRGSIIIHPLMCFWPFLKIHPRMCSQADSGVKEQKTPFSDNQFSNDRNMYPIGDHDLIMPNTPVP